MTPADPARPLPWHRRLRITLAATLGAGVVRLLGTTWRVSREQPDPIAEMARAGQPFVIALWHGELLPILWAHRDRGVVVLISTHADGEIIARIARSLGCETVRGSTSRDGARALLALVRALGEGHTVAVTPDGPRGPRRQFTPGALVAAHRAGVPIIAFGVVVDRAWRLRSWDRFVVPKPFARLRLRYSAPVVVDAQGARDAAREAPAFERLLATVAQPDDTP